MLKEKGGLNTLVQATAGETVLIPMVARGEIDLGIANMLEVVDGIETGKLQNDLRIIGSIYVLRIGVLRRARTPASSTSPTSRASACRPAIRRCARSTRIRCAMLATAGLTLNDVKPVMVPNVLRGGDDFIAGANDMFMFSFGGPRCARPTPRSAACARSRSAKRRGMPPAARFSRTAISSRSRPSPVFIGVEKPMKAYSMDNMLFTNAKMPRTTWSYKMIDTHGEEQGRHGRGRAGDERFLGGGPAPQLRHDLSIRAR